MMVDLPAAIDLDQVSIEHRAAFSAVGLAYQLLDTNAEALRRLVRSAETMESAGIQRGCIAARSATSWNGSRCPARALAEEPERHARLRTCACACSTRRCCGGSSTARTRELRAEIAKLPKGVDSE